MEMWILHEYTVKGGVVSLDYYFVTFIQALSPYYVLSVYEWVTLNFDEFFKAFLCTAYLLSPENRATQMCKKLLICLPNNFLKLRLFCDF